MPRFINKVVVVSGAGSVGPGWGNGRAIAVQMVEEGAHVLALDRELARMDETLALAQKAALTSRGSIEAMACDVTDSDAFKACIDHAMARWGRIDVLLTAAGASTGGTVDTIDEAAWDRTFAINVKGTYLWIHYAIAPMIVARSGAIVTIGSQLAQSSPGKNAAYIASKGAIASFTKTMAVDHAAQGIRVNALMPGVIDTPMPARSLKRYADPEAMRTFWKHRHPMGRIGQPEEVAKAALFLACDDSSFVTGTLLFVDGGWTAH